MLQNSTSRCAKPGKVKFPKVRSVIGQYIRGEKTLQDIVHPSKLTKISRYESHVRQSRSTLRSQRSASPRGLKSAESYPADPIVTIESEDEIDGVRFVDSSALCKMGDSLAVRGVSLKNETSIWPTSSSSPPPPPSVSTRLSRRSRTKFDDENIRIGSQAEQIAAMTTMTKAKSSLVESQQNLNNLHQQIELNQQSIAANNLPRTRSNLRPPTPAIIKNEPDIHRIRNSRSVDISPSIDQQLSGSCDSSRTTSTTDSYECFTENVNPSSDISSVAETQQSLDYKPVSSGYSEDDDETTELDITKRYLEEKINRQRAQIDELNEEIKKARHIRDDYHAAAAKIVTEGEFETVVREFLNSESWFRSGNNVSSDSVIRDYFTKCYDDLRKKVHQCESQLKVSNILVDNLEKDKNRLQNYIVELKNTRTNGMNVLIGAH